MRQWQIIFRGLRLLLRYPLRSGLVVLSVALGVSGVVCSVDYGSGGSQQVLDQIRRLGTNVLIVTPAQSRAVAGRARTGDLVTTLTERDYLRIKRDILPLTRSSALVAQTLRNKAGDLSKEATVVGCESDYFAIKDWTVESGELFDDDDQRTQARVALLGHTVAVDLFGASSSSVVGQRIMINRVPFRVVGILSERGQGLDLSNEDNQVYVPLAAAMRRLMNLDHYSGILVEIDSLSNMDQAASQLRILLHQLHHIRPPNPDDFQVQNQKTLLDTAAAASGRLGIFLRWIALSALAVSGLGIVAITWIAIKERTHEIGTRRALGATAADVFLQTQCESAALVLAGGVLGVALSWPVSRLISKSVGLPFVFDGESALLAFVASAGLNTVFSLLPSRKAASVSPIEALRYE